MLLTRLILSAFFTSLLCAPTSAAADELVGLLANIPGLTIVAEHTAPPGFRFFVLNYEQPVNHFLRGREHLRSV